MKLVSYLLFSVLFSYTVVAQKDAKEQETSKIAIHKVLDDWHKNASETNFENYFNAMDNNSVFVGTDASEVWNKTVFKNFSKPYFDKGKAWSFTPLQRNIYLHSSNTIAWFDETLNTWMGICRGSGVLEKINNSWKIKHYVLSVVIPNEDIKPIIKIKQKRDSLYLKKIK